MTFCLLRIFRAIAGYQLGASLKSTTHTLPKDPVPTVACTTKSSSRSCGRDASSLRTAANTRVDEASVTGCEDEEVSEEHVDSPPASSSSTSSPSMSEGARVVPPGQEAERSEASDLELLLAPAVVGCIPVKSPHIRQKGNLLRRELPPPAQGAIGCKDPPLGRRAKEDARKADSGDACCAPPPPHMSERTVRRGENATQDAELPPPDGAEVEVQLFWVLPSCGELSERKAERKCERRCSGGRGDGPAAGDIAGKKSRFHNPRTLLVELQTVQRAA